MIGAARALAWILWRALRERRSPAAVVEAELDQLREAVAGLDLDLALHVLPVRPGDVVVATFGDYGGPVDLHDRLAEIKGAFPANPLVALARGTTLETLSREQLDDLIRHRPPAGPAA